MKTLLLIILSISILSENINESDLVKVEVENQSEMYSVGVLNYIAFHFNMKPDWHIYWKNPGDSGLDTQIKLTSDESIEFGKILWPTPDKIPFDGMANYGFENKVTLLVPVKFFKEGEFKIKADISWLVCKELCIPQDTSFTFTVVSGNSKNGDSQNSNTSFAEYLKDIPKTKNIQVNATRKDDDVEIEIEQFKIPNNFSLEYYPYEGGIFSNGAIQNIHFFKNRIKLVAPLDDYRIEEPKKVHGLIVIRDNGKLFDSFEIESEIN